MTQEPLIAETMEEIKLPEFEIPEKAHISKDVFKKMTSLAELIDIKLDQPIEKVFENANKAIDTAKQYKEFAESTLKSRATVTITPTGEKVKQSWYDRLGTDVKLGRTVAVRGPAGNGKSTGVKETLESLGYTIYHMDCTDSTTVEQLVGALVPEPDGKGGIRMVFKDGIFTKAFQDPNAAIQLDEFDALDPRVAMALQSALHRAEAGNFRRVSCPDHEDGEVIAKGLCPIVVTMNTWGSGATREYVGRNSLDAASLDRFNTIIDTDYENEFGILKSRGYKAVTANALIKRAEKVRKTIQSKGLRVVFSTRRLIDMAESVEKLYLTPEEAFWRDFGSRLEPMDREALDIKPA